MALAAWKRIEKTRGFRLLKTSLRRLIGQEVRLRVEVRTEIIEVGGWQFSPKGLNQDSIVYSLGVGEDIVFDLAIIEHYGADVHAFDPTPSSIEMLSTADLPRQFQFHPWAITAKDGTLKFYPRVRKDGSKSTVMFTMIAEDASIEDGYRCTGFQPPIGHQQAWPYSNRPVENGY